MRKPKWAQKGPDDWDRWEGLSDPCPLPRFQLATDLGLGNSSASASPLGLLLGSPLSIA